MMTYYPGSVEAHEIGCKCPVSSTLILELRLFIVVESCPLHGEAVWRPYFDPERVQSAIVRLDAGEGRTLSAITAERDHAG